MQFYSCAREVWDEGPSGAPAKPHLPQLSPILWPRLATSSWYARDLPRELCYWLGVSIGNEIQRANAVQLCPLA